MKKTYDGNAATYLKSGDVQEAFKFFANIESKTCVLERIESNAMTFMNFRLWGDRYVSQASLREVRKGLFARMWTAEIWLNNALKDGQLKLFWNKIEEPKPIMEESESKEMVADPLLGDDPGI